MDWEWIKLVFGGGFGVSILIYLYRSIKKSGTDESMRKAHCKKLDELEAKHNMNIIRINQVAESLQDIKENTNIRLMAIEVDLVTLKTQMSDIGKDVKDVLKSIKM